MTNEEPIIYVDFEGQRIPLRPNEAFHPQVGGGYRILQVGGVQGPASQLPDSAPPEPPAAPSDE